MDIQEKSVDMDMNMDGKFHIRGKPGHSADNLCVTIGRIILADYTGGRTTQKHNRDKCTPMRKVIW